MKGIVQSGRFKSAQSHSFTNGLTTFKTKSLKGPFCRY